MIWFAPVALAAAAVPPSGTPPIACTGPGPVVFVHAAILTRDDPALLPNGTVVVRNGRITAVNPRSVPADACRIDLAGRVLLPGLADMHVHTAEAELPLFLANGVTLVREMNGTPGHLRLRDRIARGEVVGPRMLVASPLMVGAPLQYRHRVIASAAEAALAAREVKAAGYDYLKIYDGLSRESYDAFVETAAALGLPLEGHIPVAVGLSRVLETGQSLQHIEKIGMAIGGHQGDTTQLGRATALFAGRRTWVTPTLAVLRVLDGARTTEYTARLEAPEMAWVDSASLGWWRSLAGTNPPRSPSAFYRFQMAVLPVLRAAGARFLLGTDAANPLMVAGFSVHDELAALVRDGGFTPYEALLSATRNVGEFTGDTLRGRLVVGAPAELVVAESNPLSNLAVLRRPVGVMANGRWFDRAQLDSMLTASRVR
jgi:imidazolonepropionase-like amidohydrolase